MRRIGAAARQPARLQRARPFARTSGVRNDYALYQSTQLIRRVTRLTCGFSEGQRFIAMAFHRAAHSQQVLKGERSSCRRSREIIGER
jgi:hypothetical protein